VLSCVNGSGPDLLLLKKPHDVTECYLVMPGGCCRVAIVLISARSLCSLQVHVPAGIATDDQLHMVRKTFVARWRLLTQDQLGPCMPSNAL